MIYVELIFIEGEGQSSFCGIRICNCPGPFTERLTLLTCILKFRCYHLLCPPDVTVDSI